MKNNDLELKAAQQADRFDTDVLIAALQGDVNILRWMHDALAERGYSAETGEKVGMMQAYDELQDRWGDEGAEVYNQ